MAAMTITVYTGKGDARRQCEVDTSSDTLVRDVVEDATTKLQLVGHYSLNTNKSRLTDKRTLSQSGVVQGDNLRLDKRATAEWMANRRRQLKGPAAILAAEVNLGTERVLDQMAEDQGRLQEMGEEVAGISAIMQGGEVPRAADQTDKARLNQLRLQKRAMDNEIGTLREREAQRICKATHSRAEETIGLTCAAQGSVQIVAEELLCGEDVDKAQRELTSKYNAQKKVLSAHKTQLKRDAALAARAAAGPKPRGKAKAKATGKARGEGKTKAERTRHNVAAAGDANSSVAAAGDANSGVAGEADGSAAGVVTEGDVMEALGLGASSACKSGGVTDHGMGFLAWDEDDEDTAAVSNQRALAAFGAERESVLAARKALAAEEAPAAPKEMEDVEEPAARKELEDDHKTVAPKDEDDGASTPPPRGASEVTSPASDPPPSSDEEIEEVTTPGAALALVQGGTGPNPVKAPVPEGTTFDTGALVKIADMPGVGVVQSAAVKPGHYKVTTVQADGNMIDHLVPAAGLRPAVGADLPGCKIVLPQCQRVWSVLSPPTGGLYLVPADDDTCENVALCPKCKHIAKGNKTWKYVMPK